MPALKNLKHEAFAQAVANGATGAQAYRDNVAEPGSKTNTCMTQASILLSDPKIAERVEEIQAKFRDKLEKRLGWNQEKAMAYLVEVLETPVGEVDEMHRLAQEVTRDEIGGQQGRLKQGQYEEGDERQTQPGERVKIKLPSKSDAMKQLAAMAGWNAPAKVEHSGSIGLEVLSEAVAKVFGK